MHAWEVQKLVVGDIVGVSPAYSNRNSEMFEDCVVTKVNGHGHVTVKTKGGREIQFDKNGNQRGANAPGRYYGADIITNEQAKQSNAELADRRRQNALASEIINILDESKIGYGDYKLTEEVKQKLLEAVDRI